ncbi:unnamed protein product [Owenia fusiformis]|uniref:ATP synthase subunit b n=1 Tax=Owenia fusiformis TaxID=6347 RepID=A0A8J1XJV4_OWEFU|nr:unnamed protein product [Owenia fusiformis]
MFSRLALRTGAVLRQHVTKHPVIVVAARSGSTEQWDKANAIYYGPERDVKNFPITKMAEKTPNTRMGIFPESWFKYLEEKTGVSGPYVLGTGVVLTAFSKELLVIDHTFSELISFWIMFALVAKKFGPSIGKYLDELSESYMKAKWHQPIEDAKVNSKEMIKQIDEGLWREEGQTHLFEAKKENVDLQLEAQYRERLSEAYRAVKSRLDYQLDRQNTRIRFEQEHMVNWIVQNVIKGITPQQEKDAISKCIADLKGLAAKA